MSGASNVIRGNLHWADGITYLLGDPSSYRNSGVLDNDFKIANSPLNLRCEGFELSRNDHMARFRIEPLPSGSMNYINLPLRAFLHVTATTGQENKICFEYGGISYELLKSRVVDIRDPSGTCSFDKVLLFKLKQCITGVITSGRNNLPLDYSFQDDVPANIFQIHACRFTYCLSEEVRRVCLDGRGVTSIKTNDLKFTKDRITDPEKIGQGVRQNEEGHEVAIKPPVLLNKDIIDVSFRTLKETEEGFEARIIVTDDPHIDIFLDGKCLYIVLDSNLDHEGNKKKIPPEMYPNVLRFDKRALTGIPDIDNIQTLLDPLRHTLKLTIPYREQTLIPDEKAASLYLSKFDWTRKVAPAISLEPKKEKAPVFVKTCVEIDVGLGWEVGVRSELDWDVTVPFCWTEHGWDGLVPEGMKFKIVKRLSDGHPSNCQWETRKNNRLLSKGSYPNGYVVPAKDINF